MPDQPRGQSAVAAAVLEGGSPAQVELLERLRGGDESTFAELVDSWSPVLLRVARLYVSTRASAEEVVQDTWLAVIEQLDRFEGRSSLRTWVFRILENQARTRGVRDARALPWSSAFGRDGMDDGRPSVAPTHFRGHGDPWPGGWTPRGRPAPWQPPPEDAAVASHIRRELGAALDELPARQRTVVEMRDVHGLTSDEVCELLGVSPANQRLLLHRGRARLRARLEDLYRGTDRDDADRG